MVPCSVPALDGPPPLSYYIVTTKRRQRHHHRQYGTGSSVGGRGPAMAGGVRDGTAAAQVCGPPGPRRGKPVLRGLGQAHINGLEPLGPFLQLELDSLTLFERAESVHLDGGVMHEHIGPSIRL